MFAGLNTLVTTYYLAIEKMPLLKNFFPSFALYVVIVAGIAIPLLVIVGYIHMKRSVAYKAEADIYTESNPHTKRMLINTDMILNLQIELSKILVKISKNEKLTDEEIEKINLLQKQLSDHFSKKTF